MGWAVFQRVKRARFQRMGVGGSRGWGAQFPTVRDNCFYLRRGLLFSWEMSAVVWCYILAPGSQHPFPHSRPVPEAYHSGLSSCNCRPRCTPIARAPVSDCKHEPVCWPLRIKENGGGGAGLKKWPCLQRTPSLSGQSTCGLSPLGAAWVHDPSTSTLCSGALLGVRLHSSPWQLLQPRGNLSLKAAWVPFAFLSSLLVLRWFLPIRG